MSRSSCRPLGPSPCALVDRAGRSAADLDPTAAIAGLLHEHRVGHGWLGPVSDFWWRMIDGGQEPSEAHAFVAASTFLEHAPDRTRAERTIQMLGERLLGEGHVALDPDAMDVQPPLSFLAGPRSAAGSLRGSDHRDRAPGLADRQQVDGGWPSNWEAPTPAAELEWRGIVTVNALRVFREWGRF